METVSKKKKPNPILSLNNKPIDEHGYPIPKQVQCFQCQKQFFLTFSPTQQNYSQKNFWFYWTEKEKDRNKYICCPCLREFYQAKREEFLKVVSPKKQGHLRSYIARKIV